MKLCFKCKRRKPINAFYVHKETVDGHLGKCKGCTKKDMKTRYSDPEARERIAEYEKARWQRPERRRRKLEYDRTHKLNYPGKARARTKVSNAVRDGKLIKKPCYCGKIKVEAHHTDYRKPLSVIWLCHRHHLETEGKQQF